jgi:NitT/TauT family transport system ATP-binding protein
VSIELTNVSVLYNNERFAIRNVSLSIESPDTVALLGPSGAGKTTLLRVISGILAPGQQDDTVQVTGKIAVNGVSPDQTFRQSGQLAFMFQGPSLLPNLSVLKNVSLPLRLLEKPSDGEAETWLNRFGLLAEKDKLPHQLSGGMQTRVALARCFLTHPNIMLLDEPFSSLDMGWRLETYSALRQFCSQHTTTTIVVTHDINEALLLSNHICVLGEDSSTTIIRIPAKPPLKYSTDDQHPPPRPLPLIPRSRCRSW